MTTEYSPEEMTRIEQQVYMDLTNAFFESNIMHYMDRDPYGMCAFLVCADTAAARRIIDESPALYSYRGNSLIVTVNHPDR
jgi:hypothetical protein